MIKILVKPVFNFLAILGIDFRKVSALRYYLKYRAHKKRFLDLGGIITHRHVVLDNFSDQAGSARGHYFHQDLLVATFIYQNNPSRHIDVGSRVDGFVAHVASFRPIEVFDVRALDNSGHENIIFKKADLMSEQKAYHELTDSLSCLHAIEHFGLGRYGDTIDPHGHLKGLENILKILKPNGKLYISVPIGLKNEIHFNAHRVFHPMDILSWPSADRALRLERFDYVDDAGNLVKDVDIFNSKINVRYGCGIYTFTKML
jgi:hypothetical protein